MLLALAVLHLGDKLGPRVGQDEILYTISHIVKHFSAKATWDSTGIVGGGFFGLLAAQAAAARLGKVKRRGGVDLRVAAGGACGFFEDVLQFLEGLRRDIEREWGVLRTDEVNVNVECLVEDVQVRLVRIFFIGIALFLDDRAGRDTVPGGSFPSCHTSQEGNVFTREVAQGGEVLEGAWVLSEDVIERCHGEQTVPEGGIPLGELSGRAAASTLLSGEGGGGSLEMLRGGGSAQGKGGLRVCLPLGRGSGSLAFEDLEPDDLSHRNEDGEDLEHHDREMNPVRRWSARVRDDEELT